MHDAEAAARTFREIAGNFERLAGEAATVVRAAAMLVAALRGGGKAMFCGNGGSAADSQHLAAELVGRFERERRALPGLALTVDTSALTAIANDYGYEDVFARQVRALGRPGDLLVGLSTSGNSPNVLAAFAAARDGGIATLGLSGAGGGRMREACDLLIAVPSTRTARVQEMHIAVGHVLCGIAEEALAGAG